MKPILIALLFLTGCGARALVVIDWGDHSSSPSKYFTPEGGPVLSPPKPTLPEAKKDESSLSAESRGLFSPGREPL